MTSLYNLVGERLALQTQLESLDLDAETIVDTLDGDSVAINNKVEAYCFVMANMAAFSEPLESEIKRLQDRLKASQNKVQRIKEWLLINMQHAQISKIETPNFTIALQNNPASVVIEDDTLIPLDYFKTPEPPPPSLQKELIKRALKDGFSVPGARLEVKQRLVIK